MSHLLLHHFIQIYYYFLTRKLSVEEHVRKTGLRPNNRSLHLFGPAWKKKIDPEMTSISSFPPRINKMKTFSQSFRKFHLLRSTEKKCHIMLFNNENIQSVYGLFGRRYAYG